MNGPIVFIQLTKGVISNEKISIKLVFWVLFADLLLRFVLFRTGNFFALGVAPIISVFVARRHTYI